MRRPFETHEFLVALGVVCAGLLAMSPARADFLDIELRDKRVVGNELRLMVETSRSFTPFLSHSSKTVDAKGYVIFIDMASDKPLKSRARVYGPLWDVPDAR